MAGASNNQSPVAYGEQEIGNVWSTEGLGTPPIGSGGYAAWFVFVFVVLLAVILAHIILQAIGLSRK